MKIESISIHRVDDWGVIYVNGKEYEQTHSITRFLEEILADVCRENGIEFETEYHGDDNIGVLVEEWASFPKTLEQMKSDDWGNNG